jgi:toxin ParE1/3/4
MSPSDYTVRVLQPAEDDLLDTVSLLLAEENPRAAASFVERMETSLERLAKFPRLGRVPREERLAGMGYRYLVVSDYLIFYTLEKRSVLVHRILHGARDYHKLL